VNENLNLLQKYFELQKQITNLKDYNYYDMSYNPFDVKTKYSYEEAQEVIKDALSVLGKDYVSIIDKAFKERWIDVFYKKGKRSGAFSTGMYNNYHYILTNYEETGVSGVITLAHELGHTMNDYYIYKKQPYIYSSVSIFLAEIASTVNEIIVLNYFLNKTNKKQDKLAILQHILNLFKGTIFRQTQFAEFEKDVMEKDDRDEILTEKYLSDKYLELTKKYYGNIEYFDSVKYEWSRIPHFYNQFYVYQYATGMSVACAITKDILSNKKHAVENYKNFLSMGSSDYPLNVLKKCGYDLNNKKIFNKAMELFKDYLNEYEKLVNEK